MVRGPGSALADARLSGTTAELTHSPVAINPGEIAVPLLLRFRAHDGVAQPGALAGGVIDVLADRAGEQLHPRSVRKALLAIGLQRYRVIVMLRQHVRQAHRILHRLA